MNRATTGRDGRLWRRIGVIVATLTFAGVFALPWFVPISNSKVFSESQAAGFSNRVSMVALAVGVLMLILFGYLAARRTCTKALPLFSLAASDTEEAMDRWVVAGLAALTAAVTAAVSIGLGHYPYYDSAYFIDRILRVTAGAVPFSQVEFSYGPLLLYMPLLSWRLFAFMGVSVYAVYYAWVAAFQALGIAFAAFLLNRMRMARRLKYGALLVVVGFSLLQPTVGLNYTPTRFLLPFVLFVAVLQRLTGDLPAVLRVALAPAAVALAVCVSPELGVALLVALLVAFGYLFMRDRRRYFMPSMVLAILAVAGTAAAVLAGGTFADLAGGAFYFPVLPGPPTLVYVGAMLITAWCVGMAVAVSGDADAAAQLGWMAAAVVLIAPALGRSDFGHTFWNGLGMLLLCTAAMARRRRLAGGFLVLTATVFMTLGVLWVCVAHVPVLRKTVSENMIDSPTKARMVEQVLQRPPGWGERWWQKRERARATERIAAAKLASLSGLIFTGSMEGEIGARLLDAHNLLPIYGDPGTTLNESQFRRAEAQVAAAASLAMPAGDYDRYRAAAQAAEPTTDGLVMARPVLVGGDAWRYGALLGFPHTLPGRHAIFDPAASYGIILEKDWVETERVGGFVILRRR